MRKRILAVLASVLVLATALAVPAFAECAVHEALTYGDNYDGTHYVYCNDCGFETEEGHSGSFDNNGNDEYHGFSCDFCEYETVYDHEFAIGGKVLREPTCGNEDGLMTDTWCHLCGYTGEVYTFASPYMEHNYRNGVCVLCGLASDGACDHIFVSYKYSNIDKHVAECIYCKKTFAESHTWDGGRVTKQPTATENGVRTFTCKVCGGYKHETIDNVDLDKLIEDLTQEEAIAFYKKMFAKYHFVFIEDASVIAPYVEHFVTVIFPDVVDNKYNSQYFEDFAEIVEYVEEKACAGNSMYTKGYNDAMSSVINSNPVQGFFQGTWSAVVHFVSVVGNGVAIGGITLMSVICTFAIIVFAWFVIKLLKGGG